MSEINLQRRKSVMARSIKLGHCVCNPLNPCPCDTFKQFNVCPCAGEKMPVKSGPVALTKHVRKAGCASKIGQADLLRILSGLPHVADPNVLVGTAAGDDAGIYRISDTLALVQTADVFTPVVDDPHLFGQIAAANSLSDVYAMGGRPLTALSIIGFPIEELDDAIMTEILRGGLEKLEEAGCALVGGHSINDAEVKCGFAITGLIDPNRVVERGCAQAGDLLVLTKPLGTGMVSFAAQIGRVSSDQLNAVGASMAELNRDAAELMVEFGAHACTDITGFGLAGHLVEMAKSSDVCMRVDATALPVFEEAVYCLQNGILSGAIERNEEYSMAWVDVANDVPREIVPVIYDPQTSGGLLVSLPREKAAEYVDSMQNRGHSRTCIIGQVHPRGRNICLELTAGNANGTAASELHNFSTTNAKTEEKPMSESNSESCCGGAPKSTSVNSCCGSSTQPNPASGAEFSDYLKAANEPGLIDKRAKKLMAIALSVAQRCRPCLAIHMKSARAMGIAKAEMDEAANLAIAFAGCPAMMMYKEVCEELGL